MVRHILQSSQKRFKLNVVCVISLTDNNTDYNTTAINYIHTEKCASYKQMILMELEMKNEQLDKQNKIIQALEQRMQQKSLVERRDAEVQFTFLIPMAGKAFVHLDLSMTIQYLEYTI